MTEPFKPTYKGVATSVRGHFVAGPVASYILVTADAETLRMAYHEYVHVALHRVLASAPAWFHEGLAEFYSTFEMTFDNRVRLGGVLPEHVLLLRERGLMPLATLVAVDWDSASYNEGDKSSTFYASRGCSSTTCCSDSTASSRGQLAPFAGQLIDGASLQEACARALNSTPEKTRRGAAIVCCPGQLSAAAGAPFNGADTALRCEFPRGLRSGCSRHARRHPAQHVKTRSGSGRTQRRPRGRRTIAVGACLARAVADGSRT